MKTRKLVLLIANALLLVALVLQICLKSGDKTKVYTLSEQPEEITVSSPAESFTLLRENGEWFVGDKKYPANETYALQMADAVKKIKLLDKVASNTSAAATERYQLADDQKITVVAKKGGAVVRKLEIGKEANAGSQTYVVIDDEKDIYLSAGNLRNDFEKTVSYLRSRIVLNLEKSDISSVAITDVNNNSWSVSRMGSGTDVVWNCSDGTVQIDESKATDWFNSMASMTTPVWYDEGADLGGRKVVSAKIGVGFKTITLEVFANPKEDGTGETYWATCSETPYPFEMAGYTVSRFLKTLDELIK